MNNQIHIDPYRRNTELMKKFFSKPVVLIIAVAFSLLFVFQLFAGVMSNGRVNISVNVIAILNAIAFFLFYYKSKKDGYVSFKSPVVLLKIVSIISIVLFGLVVALAVAVIPFAIYSTKEHQLDATLPVLLYAVFLPAIIICLIQGISQLVFVNSIGKSTSSIYLHQTGSMVAGIATIAMVVLAVLIFIVQVAFSYDTGINHLFDNLPSSVAGELQSNLTFTEASSSIIYKLTNILQFVTYILFAVFCFMYNRYIIKLSKNINSSVPQQRTQAEAPAAVANSNVEMPQPVNFTPENVFKPNPAQTPFANTHKEQSPVNPYIHTQEPSIEPFVTGEPETDFNNLIHKCPHCGAECPENTAFCGICGTRLK